jgi:hypothetical protein
MNYRTIFLLITFLGLINCGFFDDNSDLLPIEGRILFKVSEDYEQSDLESDPEIYLFLETEKIYGCCNYCIYTGL